jgi:SAM-dependent methyltransferase
MLGANAVEGLMEGSVEGPSLMEEISEFCRQHGLAESTFGRLAINDGKLMSRLRTGGRVTDSTRARVHEFMQNGHVRLRRRRHPGHGVLDRAGYPPRHASVAPSVELEKSFRLYDNRQKYLWFVTTSNEKWVVADRAAAELANIHPRPPAVRLFDAGIGDGSVLARLMRAMHDRFPTMPHYIVGKEISLEDVRLTLEKMPDRFCEHPSTVLVMTNLHYAEAPWLAPRSVEGATSMVWHELALTGSTGYDFEQQISDLHPFLAANWQARASARTGSPVYEKPVVLVIYRDDYKFLLDSVRPRRGAAKADFDFVLASQPYRARASAEFKARRVIAPLARALGPGGRLLGIHSYGAGPGLDIIRRIWPEENPFTTDRHQLLRAAKAELGKDARNLTFNASSDARSLFRYDMHTLPNEVGANISTSTLLAAWNAAVFVAQIEDDRLSGVIADDAYLEATRDVLLEHRGLWFCDESYVISRRQDIG